MRMSAEFLPDMAHVRDLDQLERRLVHRRLERLVAVPVAVRLLDDDAALEQQALEHLRRCRTSRIGVAHAERDVLEVAEQRHVGDVGGGAASLIVARNILDEWGTSLFQDASGTALRCAPECAAGQSRARMPRIARQSPFRNPGSAVVGHAVAQDLVPVAHDERLARSPGKTSCRLRGRARCPCTRSAALRRMRDRRARA